MKQHISPWQIEELTDEQREVLWSEWQPLPGDVCMGPILDKPHGQISPGDEPEPPTNHIFHITDVHYPYPQNPNVIHLFYNSVFFHLKAKCMPLYSIGQLIDLLGESIESIESVDDWMVSGRGFTICEDELIDSLWEAVKEVI